MSIENPITSVDNEPATSVAGRLTGHLGTGSVIFMVVAAAAPLTVIAGTVPIGIAVGDGAAFPAMYVICAVILLLFATGFMAMTRHIPQAGGFYAYVGHGLGRSAGLGAAFLAVLSYTAVLVAVYGYIGSALNALISSHGGPPFPWWGYTSVILVFTAVLGYRHIDLSSKVLGVLLIAEVAIVIIVDAFVVGHNGSGHGMSTAALHPAAIASGAPGIALIFALAGFLGFEATAVYRDEARDPERTIPRATYGALILIGVFYAISSWSVISAWGDSGSVQEATTNPGGMLAATAQRVIGGAGADIVQVLLVSSLFAAVLSFHNVTARYLFALGNTGVLPSAWGRSHHKHASPYAASVAVTVLAGLILVICIAAGLDPVTEVFTWFAGIATLGVVALMLFTCLAVLVFFRRTRLDTRTWNTIIAPGIGLVALAACFVLTVANLPLLVGGSTTLAAIFAGGLAASLLAGPVVARLRPNAHAISQTVFDAQKLDELL
jgi:amino acid transporter